MDIQKIIFPKKNENYLKYIFTKHEDNLEIECGTVTLSKGQILPFKTLELHEVSYLLSGKLKVSIENGEDKIMNKGDLIYLNKDEIRRTETLEDSEVLFFLVKSI